MHSKEWLTIDDWLECGLRLCPLQIKHESRLENSDPANLMVCFASTKIGGQVLGTGCSQVLAQSLFCQNDQNNNYSCRSQLICLQCQNC